MRGADLSDLQAEAEGGQSWSKQTKTMVAPISPPYIIFVFYIGKSKSKPGSDNKIVQCHVHLCQLGELVKKIFG